MDVLLIFYNGDRLTQRITQQHPPGRLTWRDDHTNNEREFWLDTEAYARASVAEYREVAKGD